MERKSTYDELTSLNRKFVLAALITITSAGGVFDPRIQGLMTAAMAISGLSVMYYSNKSNEIYNNVHTYREAFINFVNEGFGGEKPKNLTKFICDYLDQRQELLTEDKLSDTN